MSRKIDLFFLLAHSLLTPQHIFNQPSWDISLAGTSAWESSWWTAGNKQLGVMGCRGLNGLPKSQRRSTSQHACSEVTTASLCESKCNVGQSHARNTLSKISGLKPKCPIEITMQYWQDLTGIVWNLLKFLLFVPRLPGLWSHQTHR